MTHGEACRFLIERLETTWPQDWKAFPVAGNAHPLFGENQALHLSESSHFPFFRPDGTVSWLTLAPDSDALRSAITGLRAWIIPSFAWEDRNRPVMRPSDYSGPLAPALKELSPAGYYRWHSSQTHATTRIPDKLRLWRHLLNLRPTFVSARPQSLFELREQFRLALATSDRHLAEHAITSIDERQLDTAVNSLFMRVQMRAHFKSHREITEEPRLTELLTLRMPHKVRIAIVEAFYEIYLREADESGDKTTAAKIFAADVYPTVAALLAVCSPDDGYPVARTLNYYAALTEPGERKDANIENVFFEAFRVADWRRIQDSGVLLLQRTDCTESLRTILPSALNESLKYRTNPELATFLETLSGPSVPPQTWPQFISQLRKANHSKARQFLLLHERSPLDPSHPGEIHEILESIEELFTDPASASNPQTLELLSESLPLLIEDLVGDPQYPRVQLGSTYLLLLQLWTQQRAHSLHAVDSGAAISLAGGVLRCLAGVDAQVIELLRRWWRDRQVRVRLPFLLEALDLLSAYAQDFGISQGLWIDGVSFIRAQAVDLTLSEQNLWRSIGNKLGFDQPTLDEYLPAATVDDSSAENDPLALAHLQKVAIVSLHEKAAEAAAALIKQRSGADVLVVSELVAGSATRSAHNADVVLLVWAATKHAVYRSFDDIRDKIEYVQGTGASSIVLALERWIQRARVTVV